MRIEIIDIAKVPAVIHDYKEPFKNITYRVDAHGTIIFNITNDLNLLTYDVGKAKDVSMLRRVLLKIFETIEGQEYLIRSFDANFRQYLLDERTDPYKGMVREETISFEVTLIH